MLCDIAALNVVMLFSLSFNIAIKMSSVDVSCFQQERYLLLSSTSWLNGCITKHNLATVIKKKKNLATKRIEPPFSTKVI